MRRASSVLLTVLAACAGTARAPSHAPSAARVADRYAACWRAFNERAWETLEGCYAEAASSVQVGVPGATFAGPASILTHGARTFATAFPDAHGEPQLTLVNGREVVAIVLFTGTHRGPLRGPLGDVAPTGRRVGQLVLHRVQFDEKAQIVSEWLVNDTPTLMAQLGLSSAPARSAITSGAAAPEVVVAREDEAEERLAEAYRRVYELLSQKDPAMFDLLAEDIVERNPSEPDDLRGRAALIERNRAFWTGFPDLRVDLDDVWSAGSYTVGIGHLRGTNDGEMPAMGLSKTGKTIEVSFVEIVRWEGGLAKASYPFLNSLELAIELGLTAAPAR